MKTHMPPTNRFFSPTRIGLALPLLFLAGTTIFVACSDLTGAEETRHIPPAARLDETALKRHPAPTTAAADAGPTSGSRIYAFGAFSCDFLVDLGLVTEPPAAGIERDRIFSQRYAEEVIPVGTMLQKHIPFLPLSETQGFSGGRYLFSSRYQASEYEKFIVEKFVYPGDTPFLERPAFSDPECRDWTVVKAWNFRPLVDHVAVRTERFDTGRATPGQEVHLSLALHLEANDLIAQAEAQGYAEVHLLHNLRDHKVQVVYFQPRLLPTNPDGLALETLANAEPLAQDLAAHHGLTRVFDRSHFVWTIWQPYQAADSGEPALFPNSPPLPAPFCGDGLCVPSRGEAAASCPVDCTLLCGNGVCDADETLDFCPSDCELPVVGLFGGASIGTHPN